MIRLLIVSDCASTGRVLTKSVSHDEGFEIVANIGSGDDAPSQVAELQPDVVLVDFSQPGCRGTETVTAMRTAGLAIPVLYLIERLDRATLETCLRNRAHGLLHKPSGSDELVHALRRMASGDVFVSPALANGVDGTGQAPEACPDIRQLSQREREIIAMVAAGETAADIAHRLGISGSTVYFHRRRIAGKIGLRQIADITRFAVRTGLMVEH